MLVIILFIVLLFGCIIAVATYLGISLANAHIKTDNEKIDKFVKHTIETKRKRCLTSVVSTTSCDTTGR